MTTLDFSFAISKNKDNVQPIPYATDLTGHTLVVEYVYTIGDAAVYSSPGSYDSVNHAVVVSVPVNLSNVVVGMSYQIKDSGTPIITGRIYSKGDYSRTLSQADINARGGVAGIDSVTGQILPALIPATAGAVTSVNGHTGSVVSVTAADVGALTIANNLSDLNNAATARTNLGLVIGTNVVAPNQDTTGKSAKTDALNSATTVVNVASATAPTTGQVLTATGPTAATWQTVSLTGQAALVLTASKTTTYTAAANELVRCDATTAGFTVTLPSANVAGVQVGIKKTDATANVVTISRAGSDTIDSQTTITITSQYESVILHSNGAGVWTVLNDRVTTAAGDARYFRIANNLSEGTAATMRTNLGLVIGTNVAAPNQDTTGKSAKTDALNSATTVVNVASATAPTTGQVLTATDSTHATWQSLSGKSIYTLTASKTTTYTAAAWELVRCDATSAGFTVTLPSANVAGVEVVIKKTDSTTNAVTISRAGTDTIDSATTITLTTQYESAVLHSNGSGVWTVVASRRTSVANDARYLRVVNDLSDVNASNARTNLGLGTAALISSTAGGDLSGTLPSPTVAKLNGIAATGTPAAGSLLIASGSAAAVWGANPTPGAANASTWGYAAMNMPPHNPNTSTSVHVTGTIYVTKVVADVSLASATRNVDVWVTTIGASLTSTSTVAVFDSTGAKLGSTSADQSANWSGTTGKKTASVGTFAITAGAVYYLAFLPTGTTGPCFARTANSGVQNGNTSGASLVWATQGTAASMPASITPSSASAYTLAFWAALY